MEKPYAVVYLPEEDIYSEVPSIWITKDKTQCWWPPSINARQYMVRGEKPDTTWHLHQVSVEGYSATLEGARKKAENPDYTSTQENILTGRGRRKKITKHTSGTSSDDDEDCTPPPTPKACVPSRNRKNNDFTCRNVNVKEIDTFECSATAIIESRSVDGNGIEDIHSKPNNHYSEEININELPIDIITGSNTMKELQISVEQLKAICLQNQKCLMNIYQILQNIVLKEGGENNSTENIFSDKLPVTDMEKLLKFEEELKESVELKQSYVTFMKNVGGRDPKDNINRCLVRTFGNNLGTQCSWLGHRGNFRIQNLCIIKIITDVVMLRYHQLIHLSDIEKYVSEWFRLSKQRLKREKQ